MMNVGVNTNKDSAWKDLKSGKSVRFVIFWFFVFGIVLIFVPVMFTKLSWWSFDYRDTGEIGDIIGGTTIPFISFAGVLITFLAFWIQFKANIDLRKDIEFARFENKYYELLRLHRANVEEMNIANIYFGRKCFSRMYKELKFIFYVFKKVYSEDYFKVEETKKYNDAQLCNLAYKMFFYGVEDEYNKTIDYLIDISDRPLVEPVKSKLKDIQNNYLEWEREKKGGKKQNGGIVNERLIGQGDKYFVKKISLSKFENLTIELETEFYPFDGHATRLSHYYRHLFQTVKFIVVNATEKENYLRTLRAQLSNYEQLMLYYNALSDFGAPWIENNYLTDYKMIHNIPLPLADFGKSPEDKFKKEIDEWHKKGKELFEWNEIIKI